jgi:hypothetical protein
MRFIQLYLATIILSFVAASDLPAAERISPKIPDPKLVNWMKANVSPATGMPFSFALIPPEKDVLKGIGQSASITGIIERTIVKEGVSIYDAALWQIVLASIPEQADLAAARKPVEYYWNGSLGDFANIRSGYDGSLFVYDPFDIEAVKSVVDQKGRRGFVFRIINANGKYLSQDPLDGKEAQEDFPNDAHIHWEDWKPIAGENAWVVMAALHVEKARSALERVISGGQRSIEIQLAEELARAALYLQAENGGIRMAPLGTYYHLADITPDMDEAAIAQALDERARTFRLNGGPSSEEVRLGGRDYPDYHVWYYQEISTENNLSWYAAFRMLYRETEDAKYRQAMDRIEAYFKSVWNPDEKVFYQGAHFTDGRWVPNVTPFAVDVQNWSILVLGPQMLDSWFGEGAAYEIWRATKNNSGVVDADGRLQGVGFTRENDRLTVEWTAGAIMAVQRLAAYYEASHPEWSAELRRDGRDMRAGVEQYRFSAGAGREAYSYSSKREWIPFGWFSHEPLVLSLASTAWMVLVDLDTDPFDLK